VGEGAPSGIGPEPVATRAPQSIGGRVLLSFGPMKMCPLSLTYSAPVCITSVRPPYIHLLQDRRYHLKQMKLLVAVVLLIASASASAMAQAKPVEKWECKEFLADGWKTVLVTTTVDSGRASGTITVAGVTWYTAFEVQGFNRRWDFGPKDHRTRYAFVIKPDGTGLYYDFETETRLTKASIVMECRQRDV